MSTPAIAAEARRAQQIAGARAIERLLALPSTPPVVRWEVDGVTGAVRGQLDTAPGDQAAVAVLRRIRAVHGGTVRVRQVGDDDRRLSLRFEFHLWNIELWAPISSVKCEFCDEGRRSVRVRMDPYAWVVNGEDWRVPMCDPCKQDRADDA